MTPESVFLDYLMHYRISHELLGDDLSRGRMNLANPAGVTPGDVGRDGGNAATSSAAWLHVLERERPEDFARCEAARKGLWEHCRNGLDLPGGDGSPMQLVRDSPCLSEAQKAALLGNEAYVAFRTFEVPDPARPMHKDDASLWDGIFSQRTGSVQDVGNVLANTFRQDYTMMNRLAKMEYALRAVDWLRAHRPEWVGERAKTKFDAACRRRVVVQETARDGWRTVAFLRDGEAEGWWVPDFVADAIQPQGSGERSYEVFLAAVGRVKRAQNATMTTANAAFQSANIVKDAQGLAMRMPEKKVFGVGVAHGILNGLTNLLGDYPAAVASLMDSSARDLRRGVWNGDVARALAWGALNNAAPGATSYADAREGGVRALEENLRKQGIVRLDPERERQIMAAFGHTEAEIATALDRTETRIAQAAEIAGKLYDRTYGALLEKLSRGEIRTKAYALRAILRDNPDMSREEIVEWVHTMLGTPDLGNILLLTATR